MRRSIFHRAPKAHNDNEDTSLRFGRKTARELFSEKLSAWRSFWTNLANPRKNTREDYDGIFDRPKTARVFTLSPSPKNRWK